MAGTKHGQSDTEELNEVEQFRAELAAERAARIAAETKVAERDAKVAALEKAAAAKGTRKARAPKADVAPVTLAEIVTKQTESPAIYPIDVFTGFSKARVQAGASQADAVRGVFSIYEPLVAQALAEHLESGEKIAVVTAKLLNRERKHRPTKAESNGQPADFESADTESTESEIDEDFTLAEV